MIPFYPSLKWQNLSKPILSAKVSAGTVWSPTLRWPVVPRRCNSSGRVKVQWSGRPHATGWPPSGTPLYRILWFTVVWSTIRHTVVWYCLVHNVICYCLVYIRFVHCCVVYHTHTVVCDCLVHIHRVNHLVHCTMQLSPCKGVN